MTSPANRAERAMEIFDRVCDLSAELCAQALDKACGDDVDLRAEVESLLRHDNDTRAVLDAARAAEAAHATRSSAHSRETKAPERVGQYRILRRIGEGGMGEVFEAEQESPRRRVALKVIRTGHLSPQLVKRFEREAFVLGQLQHPGIAHIYESGVVHGDGLGGQPFFAMELIDGERITDYANQRNLPLPQRLQLVARVCDAVQHAHQKAIIHRDLKPANILVVEPRTAGHTRNEDSGAATTGLDEVGQPKVLDFGVARMIEGDAQAVTLQTEVGQIVGTLNYMSPEQVVGDPNRLDTRCDVYALGVVLFQLLTDHLPLDLAGKPLAEAARIIRDEEPVLAGALDRRLRGDVETIIAKTLAKDPERRYASVAELATDLRRYLQDEPISARPASAVYQLRKFASRNRTLVGGVAATFVALVGGLASTTYYLLDANAQRVIAETQRQRVEEQRDDLEAVQSWYSELISDVDIQDVGRRLMLAIRKRVQAGLERDDVAAADVDAALAQLDSLTRHVHATDVAIDALDLALFERAERSVTEQFADHPAIRADLFATVARAYNELSRAERALGVLTRAEQAFELAAEPSEVTRAAILRGKGRALDELDRGEEEIAVHRELLNACRQEFGRDHAETLEAAVTLADSLYNAGEEADATELIEESLALHDARYPEESAVSLNMRTLLAWIEVDRGRTSEAVAQIHEIVAAHRKLQGPDHKQTLFALAEAAMLCAEAGHGTAAAELMREAVAGSERVLGSEHATTNERRRRLASVLSKQRQYEESAALLERVLEHHRTIYRPDSWMVMSIQRTIANTRFRQRRFDDASRLFAECLTAARRERGPAHQITIEVAAELGRSLMYLGRFEESEAILRETRAATVAGRGADDPWSVALAEIISVNLVGRGRLNEALEMQATELARSRETFGDRAIRTATLIREHMRALNQAGRYAEAEPLAHEFLALARDARNVAATVETLVELGSIQLSLGKPEAAFEALDEGFWLAEHSSGTGVLRLRVLRGAAMAALGCPEDAEPLMLEAYLALEAKSDSIHIVKRRFVLSECAGRIASMYAAAGRQAEAAIWSARRNAVELVEP